MAPQSRTVLDQEFDAPMTTYKQLQRSKNLLTGDKVWELPKVDQAQRLQRRFNASWTAQDQILRQKNEESYKYPRVHAAMWAATKDKMIVAMCLLLVTATLTLAQPFLIQAILKNLIGEENIVGISSGYGLALLLGCVAFCAATAMNLAMLYAARASCNA
ncbi:unnamed protein product [Peronospora belbahrii]|uniref:ABC transmembrane type-1 domain-containing protein n=1 Tax=Peronospora belbahrii TaxID=622444 RepID=A0ABN8CS75_9STRA|nr:unnamed protein product [Peronospora belbahrii]